MAVHGDEISWQVLRRIVHDWVGTAVELAEVKPLGGGSISQTVAITTSGGDRAVLKISQYRVDRSYLHEAYQLNVLRAVGLPTPQVYSCRVGTLDDPNSYLLIEHLNGVDLAEARNRCDAGAYDHLQMHLADLTRTLHGQTNSCYTRLTEGDRDEFTEWPAFYRNVFDAIWQEAEKQTVIPVKVRKQIAKIHEKLEHFIGHADCPRLVHWDLWASNVLAAQDGHGKWWVSGVLDPNCKYAHAEAEIAYMELFRTVTPAFLRVYQGDRKLGAEYHEVRKHVYQMYSLVNHVQLFGGEYVKPLLGVMEKVGRFV